MGEFGILEELLRDANVSEIMVNGFSRIYFEKSGKLYPSDKTFKNNDEVYKIIENILKPLGKNISSENPYVDTRLSDGSRVNIIVPPISISGPMLTIRKFSKNVLSGKNLIDYGSLNENMLEFLKFSVENKQNIIVSGGTGSGKTTLLNILSSFIPKSERIISIEDTAELQLNQENFGRLEARPADINGKGEISIRQLVINALRMRPDRIVVGECRGAEALDMLQAMNTGHNGSLTTIHANTPKDCLKRIETMVLMSGYDLPVRAIREQVASAINLIIQVSRMLDGSRKIIKIIEITGMEGDVITISPIYEFKDTGMDSKTKLITGEFKATGNIPTFVETLKTRRINVPMEIFR